MKRHCPSCDTELPPLAVRCVCGAELPEARDLRSDPDRPGCGLCGQPMELMAESCASCGAGGYPALRPRRSRKSFGAPPDGGS